jgi:hypothetical protein
MERRGAEGRRHIAKYTKPAARCGSDWRQETGRTVAVGAGHYADILQSIRTLTRGMYSYH